MPLNNGTFKRRAKTASLRMTVRSSARCQHEKKAEDLPKRAPRPSDLRTLSFSKPVPRSFHAFCSLKPYSFPRTWKIVSSSSSPVDTMKYINFSIVCNTDEVLYTDLLAQATPPFLVPLLLGFHQTQLWPLIVVQMSPVYRFHPLRSPPGLDRSVHLPPARSSTAFVPRRRPRPVAISSQAVVGLRSSARPIQHMT